MTGKTQKEESKTMNIRELILNMLMELESEGTYSSVLIRNVLDKYDYLPPQEKSFLKRVTEGTLERRIQIDYIIDSYSKIPVKKMKPLIRSLLRMSVYQILFMDAVPDSAVCNEAVKLASARKFQNLKGFVNGVLRNIARNREPLNGYPDKEKQPVEYLSVVYSMPELIIRMWLDVYGTEKTEKIVSAMLEIHPVTIRMKESLPEQEKKNLLEEMKQEGIGIAAHPYLPYAYNLTHLEGIRNVPGFAEGLFTVQDVSSMFCVESAGIKKGDFVVDVCAAPGGKTTHAAEKLNGSGHVLSRDISQEKTALIEENVKRQRLEQLVETEVYDAAVCDDALIGKADVVLADLPCSGLGILGKKRDIKYHVTEESLTALPELQKKILDVVWRYVKPGGVLVYSTCTIHRKENEEIARWFLAEHPFTAENTGIPLQSLGKEPEENNAEPEKSGTEPEKNEWIQFLPGLQETDGFFIAKFRRNK